MKNNKRSTHKRISLVLFMLVSVIYMENLTVLFTCGFKNGGFVFATLFSVAVALVLGVFCSFFKPNGGRRAAAWITGMMFVMYGTQTVYYSVFKTFLILYSLKVGGTDQVIENGIVSTALNAILGSLPKLLLLALPLVFIIIFGKSCIKVMSYKWLDRALCFAIAVTVHFLCVLVIIIIPAPREVFVGAFDAKLSTRTFGVLRTEWLDFKYGILGFPTNSSLDNVDMVSSGNNEPAVVSYEKNVLNIDFSALAAGENNQALKTLNQYFASQQATYQNEHTGKFEGYNLIMITAEGFSPYAVDKSLTPTLYKMANEGIKFNNFYNPVWGVSTSDGEYVACTGLIPKSGIWSFFRSGSNYMPFCMGNQFNRIISAMGIGKKSSAYHNHTYTYYHRDVSHPNMGYNYVGYGNGLEGKIAKTWPESDLEMIEATASDYITADAPFHAYYMTVSGHLIYSFEGNAMAKKNKGYVENLTCSDTVKAYMACNIEFDRAMEKLLQKLNEAGVAERTVIVITNDHYPYGLLDEESSDTYRYFNELLGHKVDETFELYKGELIIYCQGMKPETVDKYCCSMDIIPTVSNLFGLKYDSRLMMGRDIFSNAESLVIFSDRSWISSVGKYDSSNKTFVPFNVNYFTDDVTNQTVTDSAGQQTVTPVVTKTAAQKQEEYVTNMKSIVSNKFKVSALMLENDYYNKVVNEAQFDYSNYRKLDPVKTQGTDLGQTQSDSASK